MHARVVLGVGKGVITVLAVKLSQTTAMVRPTRCRHAVMFYLIQSTVCVSHAHTHIYSPTLLCSLKTKFRMTLGI